MATENSVAPIIIKKKKAGGGDGHHGGAWKVAYADFVTAMMAFFLLMWLLNATTEKQRKGIADYFNPTIPVNRVSGGGSGAFGGDSIFSEQTLSKSGTGASGSRQPWIVAQDSANSQADRDAAQKLLEEVNATVLGSGGESELMENALKHVISRITDEGVVVEIFDLPGSPLFSTDNETTTVMKLLLARVAEIASNSDQGLAIVGHTRSVALARADHDLWKTSTSRVLATSRGLEFSGVEKTRFDRLTGKANTEPASDDPLSTRNNRIEIIFLIE